MGNTNAPEVQEFQNKARKETADTVNKLWDSGLKKFNETVESHLNQLGGAQMSTKSDFESDSSSISEDQMERIARDIQSRLFQSDTDAESASNPDADSASNPDADSASMNENDLNAIIQTFGAKRSNVIREKPKPKPVKQPANDFTSDSLTFQEIFNAISSE